MQNTLTRPIAEGRTAEVYAWQDDSILKLYREWCPPDWMEYEYKVVHAVVDAGIPTPAAKECVEVNGRRGIVFERVKGISMLQDINAHPWNVFKHAHTLAELQARINQLSLPRLSRSKEGLAYSIQQAPHLDDRLREKALDLLSKLRDGDRVCHGDFHPGNVMLTDKGAVVIDWMTVTAGNPTADFARTNMILMVGPKGAGKQLSLVGRRIIEFFRQMYSRSYLQLMPDTNNERSKWLTVISASRLAEQIQPERDALLQLVKGGLGI